MIKVNNIPIEINYYPDGALRLKYSMDADTDNIQYRICWLYEHLNEQIVLQNLVWHMKEKNPDAKITLLLPYVLNARMDRTQNPDEVFTLKYFIRFINELEFHRVYVLDPHSSVTSALLNNVTVDNGKIKEIIDTIINKTQPDLLYYPDNGCQKRLETLIKYPHIVGYKNRDWDSGDIIGTEVLGADKYDLNNKKILIVDDICSYGGTFLHATKKLKELGVGEVFLYITHCENSILDGELIKSGLLEKIYTTQSIFTKSHELIEIIGGEISE